jgi:hypothetical protein
MKSRAQIIRLLSAACATLPAAAELNFPQVVLDASFVAYERDVGDIDGDGLNDVVATSDGGTAIEWFRAPDWNRATLVTLTGTYRYTRADDFKVADVDGDNDADLVVRLGSGPSDDGEGRAAWIENLGSGTGWVTRIIGTSPSYGKDIATGDLDRDGRLDLVYREDSLTQIWFNETNLDRSRPEPHRPRGHGTRRSRHGRRSRCGAQRVLVRHPQHPRGLPHGRELHAGHDRQRVVHPVRRLDRQLVQGLRGRSRRRRHERCGVLAVRTRGLRGHLVQTQRRRHGPAHTVAPIDYAHNLQAYDADLDGDLDLLTGGMPQSSHKGCASTSTTDGHELDAVPDPVRRQLQRGTGRH